VTADFTPGISHHATPEPESIVFVFQADRLVLHAGSRESEPVELQELGTSQFVTCVYLGLFGDRECFGLSLGPEAVLPTELKTEDLRESFSGMDDAMAGIAGRAFQLVHWRAGNAFCGRCGAATEPEPDQMARRCRGCDQLYFPRINPAVITMVERGDSILLARNKGFRRDFYSVLAGFVEPAETLERAVMREVREEVGIEVRDIRYFGSQSWPFPSQLMVAFTAKYASGEISIQELELSDAGWFTVDRLPTLPRKGGMGRRLIDSFVARRSTT